MVEAATNFRKSGFNNADSAMLAQVAAQYQNIADTAVSAGEAAALWSFLSDADLL